MPLFENRISPLLGHIKIRDFFILPSVRQSLPEFLFFNGPVLREGYNMMDLAGWKTSSMALRYQHGGDVGCRRAMGALESMVQVEQEKIVELYRSKK